MSVYEDDPGHGRPHGAGPASRSGISRTGDLLNDVLTTDVLPRLRGVHAGGDLVEAAGPSLQYSQGPIAESEIDELYQAVLGRLPVNADNLLARVSARGVARGDIHERLLRPVALMLGEGWLSDDCNFFEVSVGVSKLHQSLHSPAVRRDRRSGGSCSSRTVLLAGAPGEQHLFGLGIIEQSFAEAGWNVTNLAGADWDTVCDCLQTQHQDLLGISCAGERLRPNIKSAIAKARFTSTHRDIKVLVGGHLFENDRTFVRSVEADGFASDSSSAIQAANGLVPVTGELTEPCD
jgi:methanogenic corrinoid protein MtbC1